MTHLSKWSISIPVFWATIIAILSLIPPSEIKVPGFVFQDKIGHVAAYGLLAWLTIWSVSKSAAKVKPVYLLFIVILYGVTMEFIQLKFFLYRSFEIFDIVANIIGSFGGYLIFKYLKK